FLRHISVRRNSMSVEARKMFQQEITNINREIGILQQRREHLHALLATYSASAGSTKRAPAVNHGQSSVARTPALTTGEMAREIIRKHGPLAPAEISRHIRDVFKVQPAKNLRGVLYKKASKKSGFIRLKDGKYGLLSPKKAK